jgi:hypothetical protein
MRPDKWTILLTGDNSGCVGKFGDKWAHCPEHFERVDVYAREADSVPAEPEEPSQAIHALQEVCGCFDAAYVEGLADILANSEDEKLKDLVNRRLLPAYWAAQALLPAPPAPVPSIPELADQPGLF